MRRAPSIVVFALLCSLPAVSLAQEPDVDAVLDPDDTEGPPARVDLTDRLATAQRHQELGRFEEALAEVAALLAVEPDNHAALRVGADAALGLGRFDDALSAIDRAIELAPDEAEYALFRAHITSVVPGAGESTVIDVEEVPDAVPPRPVRSSPFGSIALFGTLLGGATGAATMGVVCATERCRDVLGLGDGAGVSLGAGLLGGALVGFYGALLLGDLIALAAGEPPGAGWAVTQLVAGALALGTGALLAFGPDSDHLANELNLAVPATILGAWLVAHAVGVLATGD